MNYDDQPENVPAERSDPRVDLMRKFSDLDRGIRYREQEDEDRRKTLAELKSKRENLREKIREVIADGDEAVSISSADPNFYRSVR